MDIYHLHFYNYLKKESPNAQKLIEFQLFLGKGLFVTFEKVKECADISISLDLEWLEKSGFSIPDQNWLIKN